MSGASVAAFDRIKKGDTVALLAPAGPVDPERAEGAVKLLESAGLKVSPGRSLFLKERYLAGPDETRLEDLRQALDDPGVKAVFLARGGYGTQRIVYGLRRPRNSRPKPVIGFSDNTALLGFLGKKWGWPSIHGPHPRPDCPGEFEETLACLTEGVKPSFTGLETLKSGAAAEGQVVGGCLSILSSSVGTACMPDFRGRIAFLEDVSEPPYRIDRLLNHLLNARVLRGAVGVVFGEPGSFSPPASDPSEVVAVLKDFASRVAFPVVCGLPSGHVEKNRPLFLGVKARLSPGKGTLAYLEGIVR